jgi:L-lysine exporter family protein LysE/ArgO
MAGALVAAIVHGVVLAFGLILALGPQNVFVFSQGAVQPRFSRALPVVLAASFADTALILLAVGGASAVVLAIPWVETALVGLGVVFLLYVGLATWRSEPEVPLAVADGDGAVRWTLGRQVGSTLSISLLNPHAILDTVGVIGPSSLAYAGSERAAFAAACVCVSWAFFFALALAGRAFGKLGAVRQWMGKVSAVAIWSAALYLALGLLP